MINIIYTSQPHDGLFYYSYEYFIYLKNLGYNCNFIIFPFKGHKNIEYTENIISKYNIYKEPLFNEYKDGINIMMGRSLLIFADQSDVILKKIMKNPLVLVYNNNHSLERQQKILDYFKPEKIHNLCDREVYPDGIGENFIKTINFSIYKEPIMDIQFKYLFNGSNERYYSAIMKVIDNFKSHKILVYNKTNESDLEMPVDNLLGKFETYVYTKDYFDPAPRLIQECSFYGKNIIYQRKDLDIPDGGSVYYKRYKEGLSFNLINNSSTKNLTKILDLYE